MTVLNHLLAPSYLNELLFFYREMLQSYGQPHDRYFELLADFFKERPAFVLQELQDILSLDAPVTCEITVPEDVEILVDGYPYRAGYQGTYFTETPLTVELTDQATISEYYWLVNGKRVNDLRLELSLDADTEISLAFPSR